MKISVIGGGCAACEGLFGRIEKLKSDGKISAELEYIGDYNELVERGIMGSPAILVDDEPVFVGVPKNDEELLKLFQ